MFDPALIEETEAEKARLREARLRIEEWSKALMPEEARSAVRVNVSEVKCGDVACPIDTAVEFYGPGTIHYGFGLPKMARYVERVEIEREFPPADILLRWARGDDAEWPEPDDPPDYNLQFKPGDRVDAYLGGAWRPATVVQQWWRDSAWPKFAWVCYRIHVDDTDVFTYAPCEARLRSPMEPKRLRCGRPDNSVHEPAWRFQLDDRVECRCPDGWLPGTVINIDLPDPSEPLSFTLIPYIVKLDPPHHRSIAVPFDDAMVIRALA